MTKRRENDAEDEEDNASRDNTDVVPTPESERSTESKCYLQMLAVCMTVCHNSVHFFRCNQGFSWDKNVYVVCPFVIQFSSQISL